jgi:hypothetical protein
MISYLKLRVYHPIQQNQRQIPALHIRTVVPNSGDDQLHQFQAVILAESREPDCWFGRQRIEYPLNSIGFINKFEHFL